MDDMREADEYEEVPEEAAPSSTDAVKENAKVEPIPDKGPKEIAPLKKVSLLPPPDKGILVVAGFR